MRSSVQAVAIALAVAFLAGWCSPAGAQTTTAPARPAEPLAAAGGTLVLDTTGAWRMYHVLKSPVVQEDGALKEIPHYDGNAKLSYADTPRRPFRNLEAPETAAAPVNWETPTFDDSDWPRGTAVRAMRSPYLERLCLRGKFTITDLTKVKGLSVLVDYHGGAIVYVNGREIGRQNLQADGKMAEEYPLDAFVGPDGKLIHVRGDEALQRNKTPPDVLKRIQDRVRKFTVAVPPLALRPGLNVVAVELVRAPYHKVVDEQMANIEWNGTYKTWDLSWDTCQIKRVQVTAASAEGLVPCASRAAGFEMWNSNALAVDYDMDQGDGGPLQPIRLCGARGGAYSGKVVLGSDKPIHGLSATAGELKADSPASQGSPLRQEAPPGQAAAASGTIPAAQVQARYAMPWGDMIITNIDCYEMLPYQAVPTPLTALYETPPKEIPVYRGAVNNRCLKAAGAPAPVFGAVVPIWVTVKVPKDAKPGTYTGQVMVSAEGLKATPVAVSIKVVDWTIPDPQQRRTWVELIQSPDTLSLEYNVPLWSEKHWDLIARSMDYLGAIGSHVLYAPLIAQSNAGNDESMVRWVPKGDGTYEYDFSILDKYLDVAEKHMGKPQVIVCNVWDWYMGGVGGRVGMYKDTRHAPPLVTVLDKATGKTRNVAMLDYFDANAKAQWKPLFDPLKERMQKRGLEKAVMLGLTSDNWPYKDQIEFLKDASGNLPWANTGHYTRNDGDNGVRYGYNSSMFGYRLGPGDYLKTRYGWNLPRIEAFFPREPLDTFLNNHWRGLPEMAIFGNMRGVGRFGGDTWHVVKDAKGNRVARAWERFPASSWGYLNCNCAALAPAPEGAVATAHYEALREGLQECEARVAVEQALIGADTKAKVGDLAKDYNDLMVERQVAFWRSVARYEVGPHYQFDDPWAHGWQVLNGQLWLVQSLWQERGEKLYSFAGQIARKLEGK